MSKLLSKLFSASVLAVACSFSTSLLAAQPPLRIVIGFPPGGVLDTFARSLAEEISKRESRPVVVVNKPGASTLLAVNEVARAKPDGSTILLTHSMPFTIYPYTYDKLQHTQDDFAPIGYLASIPIVMTSGKNQPFNTAQQYIAWLRKNPDQGAVGVISLGGQPHFALLQMAKAMGVPVYPVPYPGTPQLLNDQIGGNIGVGLLAIGPQIELYRAGKINLLGLAGQSTVKFMPEVKTLESQGIQGFDKLSLWYGAYFPKDTPSELVNKYEKMLTEIVNQPVLQKKFEGQALILDGKSKEYAVDLLDQERKYWQPIIQKSGFKADK